MATIKIEGKEVTLPDDVVKAGPDAIRAVLAANGFPAVEGAHIEIEGGKSGAPAIVKVSPRAPGKGAASVTPNSPFRTRVRLEKGELVLTISTNEFTDVERDAVMEVLEVLDRLRGA